MGDWDGFCGCRKPAKPTKRIDSPVSRSLSLQNMLVKKCGTARDACTWIVLPRVVGWSFAARGFLFGMLDGFFLLLALLPLLLQRGGSAPPTKWLTEDDVISSRQRVKTGHRAGSVSYSGWTCTVRCLSFDSHSWSFPS